MSSSGKTKIYAPSVASFGGSYQEKNIFKSEDVINEKGYSSTRFILFAFALVLLPENPENKSKIL